MIEIPFWLVLSLFAVLFWGIGENFTKKATGVLRAPTMLLFYAWAALVVWGGYWYLKGHPVQENYTLHGYNAFFEAFRIIKKW